MPEPTTSSPAPLRDSLRRMKDLRRWIAAILAASCLLAVGPTGCAGDPTPQTFASGVAPDLDAADKPPDVPRRPNIVILFTDDQQAATVDRGVLRQVRTPNIDRLSGRGVSMRSAYVMGGPHGAVCMPSRAMLLTGMHHFRLPRGITWTWSAPSAERGRHDGPTLPSLLRDAGYETFFTGKWHNGRPFFAANFEGGDAIFFGGMSDHDAVPVHEFDPTGRYEASNATRPDTHSSELFTDAALEFLRDRDGERPFLLMVSYTAPHDPRTSPKPFASMYPPEEVALPANFMSAHPFPIGDLDVRDERLAPLPRTPEVVREHIADYHGIVTHLDAQIGRMLDELDDRGFADDTVVILVGDNGLALGQHGLLGKQNIYEHSSRVPMIVAGPGVPAGETRDGLCYVHDLFPTVLEWCGVPVADNVDARSLVPMLSPGAEEIRPTLLLGYSTGAMLDTPDGPRPKGVLRGVRSGEWKLIESWCEGVRTTRLFDLESDPWELQDLSELPALADRLAALRVELARLMREAGDPIDPAIFAIDASS